jgi:hypothetical protein
MVLFGIINYRHFHRPQHCADCFFPYGWPFTMYHDGGFAGGEAFVWSGLAGDLILMLGFGVVLGWIFKKIFERRSGRYSTM